MEGEPQVIVGKLVVVAPLRVRIELEDGAVSLPLRITKAMRPTVEAVDGKLVRVRVSGGSRTPLLPELDLVVHPQRPRPAKG